MTSLGYEVIEGSHLVRVVCVGCGRAPSCVVPEYASVARCIECRRADSGVSAYAWATPRGEWHPAVGYPSIGLGPRPESLPAFIGPAVEYTADPEVPIPADLSLPEPEDPNPWPAPEVTSLDPVPDWVEEPSSMMALVKAAEKAGWLARCGYSRGSIEAAKRGTWKVIETSTVWLLKAGQPRMAFSWKRNPESKAAGGPAWAADGAIQFDSTGNARMYGHLEGRGLL
jgi:hypothetical protein